MTLRLRDVDDDDLDAMFAWERDPAGVAMAAFTRADPSDRAAFDRHYLAIRSDPSVRLRAIELDGEAVGTVATFDADGDREITYWVAPQHWGAGIATRAVALLLAEEPVRPLVARVAAANAGSRRVLERSGFVEVGRERSFAAGIDEDVDEIVLRLP